MTKKEYKDKPDQAELKKMAEELLESSAYKVAFKDQDFLQERFNRPVRLQLELLKPEVIFAEQGVDSTIVVFGGTRIVEPEEAEKQIKEARQNLKASPDDRKLIRKLEIAVSINEKSKYYDEAREFGRIVSQAGQNNNHAEWVIVTGGGPGIMEAANRGAYDVGAKSIGLNITLPLEQDPNPYISPELCLQFHYFALRKMHFLMRAKALVAFPGGYGTMDELFEALTLVQTGKTNELPIVLVGKKFWKTVINFDALVDEGVIAPEELDIFYFADTAQEAWDHITRFYMTKE